MQTYEVMAHWDAEAKVWWAESSDVPGLVAESDTKDGLMADLRVLVPELLVLNKCAPAGERVQLRVIMEETEDLCLA